MKNNMLLIFLSLFLTTLVSGCLEYHDRDHRDNREHHDNDHHDDGHHGDETVLKVDVR
jgi:hypothetical protein